jgi:hypothetical protein
MEKLFPLMVENMEGIHITDIFLQITCTLIQILQWVWMVVFKFENESSTFHTGNIYTSTAAILIKKADGTILETAI